MAHKGDTAIDVLLSRHRDIQADLEYLRSRVALNRAQILKDESDIEGLFDTALSIAIAVRSLGGSLDG